MRVTRRAEEKLAGFTAEQQGHVRVQFQALKAVRSFHFDAIDQQTDQRQSDHAEKNEQKKIRGRCRRTSLFLAGDDRSLGSSDVAPIVDRK